MVIVMFIKNLIVFLLILIIGALGVNAINYTPTYVPISDAILDKVATELAKRHDMHWIGTSAAMMDCIKMTGMRYNIYRPLDKAEARRLIVDCVEEYIAAINASKQIRPFLQNYPVTAANIDIAIFSYNADRRTTYDPYIGTVSCRKGMIYYYTEDKDNEFRYKSETEETYDEALAIIKKEAEEKPLPERK